jgi:hypothetical protein
VIDEILSMWYTFFGISVVIFLSPYCYRFVRDAVCDYLPGPLEVVEAIVGMIHFMVSVLWGTFVVMTCLVGVLSTNETPVDDYILVNSNIVITTEDKKIVVIEGELIHPKMKFKVVKYDTFTMFNTKNVRYKCVINDEIVYYEKK